MSNDDYARALQLIALASEHILYGNYDSAMTVLRSAYRDGHLDRGDRLAGRLHYEAVLALIDVRKRNSQAAARRITQVIGQLDRVSKKARPDIVARCNQVMMELPHVRSIQKQLKGAKDAWERREYVKAYRKIKDARGLLLRYARVTPPSVSEAVTQAATEAMIHLMKNNPPKEAIAITTDLQKRGLIES